jgi:hypothetical protein
MKKRAFTLINFLALMVLFFAVYLNFIHKDINSLPPVTTAAKNMTAVDSKSTLAVTAQKKH